MSDTWTDRKDFDQSAADHAALLDEMQRTWTWPTPSGPTLDADGLTALERASLEVGIADDNARRARAEWVALLPELTADLRCTNCGAGHEFGDLDIREIGHERWTRCDVQQDDDGSHYLVGSTDGWDDITESGTEEWVHCMQCNTAHQCPTNVEWQ